MIPLAFRSSPQSRKHRKHWRRLVALVVVAFGLLIAVPGRAAANLADGPALRVTQFHRIQQDGVVGPPGAPCGSPVWTTAVSFVPNGWPISNPRFGSGPGMVGSATIAGLSYPPGTVTVNAVITWDGHPIRHDQSQASESVRLEFASPSGVVATGLTPDLADNVASASSSAGLGTFDLSEGATEVRVVHSGAGGSENSVVVSAICLSFTPAPETTVPPATTVTPTTEPPTTVPSTTVTPSTEPPTTVPPTTEPPTTVPPTTEPPVPSTAPLEPRVEPDSGDTDDEAPDADKAVEPETQVKAETELARTGPSAIRQPVGVALTLIGLGVYLSSVGRRKEE